MCTTSGGDLEDIPLEDDDSNSIEFKILEFYVKHHVFKRNSSVFSPKLLRTRSLSQKGLGRWSSGESRVPVSGPCQNFQSSEKSIPLAKKKSSWRTLFGVIEKEEDSPSVPTAHFQGPSPQQNQGASISQQWFRSHSNVEQRVDHEVVAPEVVSIANRVAEIVYSWPPTEELQPQGFSDSKATTPRTVILVGHRPKAAGGKKDGEDQILARIVEVLKYSGDHLERELRKDKSLMSNFQEGLSYPLFKAITDKFLQGVDTRGESEVKAQSFKAALAIDVMAKLTAIDNHPMNRVLGFGTKYLKENFSPWVQQHGGWEKVLGPAHEVD
ncbi:apoptosis facilitator Bcl-2-like protein 14 isoform X2 [Talpa occidentalis]|nr:apoptosis facilitator Bcl-2-like protein 14 isoform X2 [Talpa occidentalis]XP_037371181.1 apoptosis facilitator Bcl-2-like protein 14 isoform X2 [Talpa occidentalis]XP_037371182.1 apoptosis facilitator Bcl-2-like protein 14 isoform X2 [Talpa occidentalis]